MSKVKVTIITVLFFGLIGSSCNKHIAQRKETTQTYYTCPMHKDVFEVRPGKCPKCGMELQVVDWDNYSTKKSGSSGSSTSGSGSNGGHSGHNH